MTTRLTATTLVVATLSLGATACGTRNVEIRFDVLNLFDSEYRLRDGTGIGVGAPQFGARRGFFGGLSRAF